MCTPMMLALCFASAAFYALVTVVLKVTSGVPFLFLVPLICVALGVAAWIESLVLPAARIGIVLALILAFEVLITAAVALALGESYRLREFAGLGAILIGIVILFGSGETASAR